MKLRVEGLIFQCDNEITEARARTLLTKEPGTIAWLNDVKKGDVFYDIGANVGCYSLLAAQRGAWVVAFEPHLATAATLARNVELNKFQRYVTIIPTPLDEFCASAHFAASSDKAGSSGHNVSQRTGMRVFTLTLDHLLTLNLPQPNMMKIDVDGNELRILSGGTAALTDKTLRSVQVEMPLDTRADIHAHMREHGFTFSHIHYTKAGQHALDGGADPATIVHNAVFVMGI